MRECVSGAQPARGEGRDTREARVKALVRQIEERDPDTADAVIDLLFRMVDKK
jgi:hypothetical protein